MRATDAPARRPAPAPAQRRRDRRPERGPGSLGTKEFLLVLGGAFLLAAAMFWPLPLHLSRDVPLAPDDSLLQAWEVAWGGHALVHQPLHFWDANLFFPNRDSLAFSDSLAGFAPLGLVGQGFEAALARYNLLFLFTYALALAGAYALGRELGLSRPAALVAGAAFAYSPWRWEQSSHLNILASGTIPLSLALLVRGYRLGRPRAIVGGWLAAAWQVLIGVWLGLVLCSLLAVLAMFVLVRWLRAHRPRLERPVIAASVGGVAALLAASALVLPAYLRVEDAHPEVRRSLEEVRLYSPPLRAFLSAPMDNPIWGEATEFARSRLPKPREQTLFPGLATVALAAVGLATGAFSRRLRLGLLIAAALAFVFSLGMTLADGRLTWRLLHDLPGWSGLRTPGRLHTLTTLALALLAGAGVQWLAARAGSLRSIRPRAAATAAVVAAVVLAEGSAWRFGEEGAGAVAGPPLVTVPRPPVGLEQAREPLVHIPPGGPGKFSYMIWATEGFPRTVNGVSGFEPRNSDALKDALSGFPDKKSVAALRRAGVRTAVLHPPLAAGTEWEHAPTQPLEGLPLVRRPVGEVVLFELR